MSMPLTSEQREFFFKISKAFVVTGPNTKPKTYWLTVEGKRKPFQVNQGQLLLLRTAVRDAGVIPDELAIVKTAEMVCYLTGHLVSDVEVAKAARALHTEIAAHFPGFGTSV